MNQYDLAGTLQTYAYKAVLARNREHLMEIIDDIRYDLDKRKITFVGPDKKETRHGSCRKKRR